MLTSRAVVLGRVVSNGLKARLSGGHKVMPVRNGHDWHYRTGPHGNMHPRSVRWGAEMVGGFMWWWVLWHLWHEPEHITGEYPYPDATKWSNAELGVPPDDYEE